MRGIVQGVGFRPFRLQPRAARGLAGWVGNQADTVRIEVQGDSGAVDDFSIAIRAVHPPQARIDALDVQEREAEHARRRGRFPDPHQPI